MGNCRPLFPLFCRLFRWHLTGNKCCRWLFWRHWANFEDVGPPFLKTLANFFLKRISHRFFYYLYLSLSLSLSLIISWIFSSVLSVSVCGGSCLAACHPINYIPNPFLESFSKASKLEFPLKLVFFKRSINSGTKIGRVNAKSDKKDGANSVTRCGKMSPLWQNLNSFWAILWEFI